MKRTLELILCGPAQARQVMALAEAAFQEAGFAAGKAHYETLRQLLVDAAAGRVYLAVHHGAPAGLVTVLFRLSVRASGRVALVEDFYIEPSVRERAVTARILKAVLHDLEAFGLLEVHLQTAPDSSLAAACSAAGFEQLPARQLRFTLSDLVEDL